MDPSHGELKTCPAGARLSFPLHLATLATTRHIEYVIDLKVHLVSSHDVKDGIQSVTHGYLELVYLVTALVPSDTACLANSPGRSRRTAVWISREVMVDLDSDLTNSRAEKAITSCYSGPTC